MKRDLDLIREIVLEAESAGPGQRISYEAEIPVPMPGDLKLKEIPDNLRNQKVYNAHQLMEAGILVGDSLSGRGNLPSAVMVVDLSPKGHDFAESIRSDTNWNKLKERTAKAGGWVLEALIAAAISAAANRLMG